MKPPSFQVEQPVAPEDETTPKKRRNIVSPWENVAEFEEVRNHIYGLNANPNTWKQAIVELKIWTNRRRSQCPAAVFATLTMLEAKLHEENANFEESDLQSLYAFALIRFFNYMSSTIQTHNMRSMYNTAIEMGLASFVVDLRHICAHGSELPELLTLRKTTNYCLNWLYSYYWSVQTQKMVNADSNCLQQRDKVLHQRAQQVEELMKIFDIAFECHLNACATAKDVKERIRGQRLTKLKSYWKTKNLSTIRETFDAVVSDMIALTKYGLSQKNLAAIFAKAFTKMNYFFNFVENHNIEYELAYILDVVQNLFRFLAVYNIVETVLHQLLDMAESAQTAVTQRTGAAFWAKQIIIGMSVFMSCKKHYVMTYMESNTKTKFDHSALNFGKITNKNTVQTYKNCGVDLQRTIIFGDSFQRPWVWSFNRAYLKKRVKAINEQTRPVLQSLITLIKPKMTSDEIEKLNKITSVYLKQSDMASDSESAAEIDPPDKIFTLNDICGELQSNKPSLVESPRNDTINLAGWQPLQEDEYDWANCPIGRVPWQ